VVCCGSVSSYCGLCDIMVNRTGLSVRSKPTTRPSTSVVGKAAKCRSRLWNGSPPRTRCTQGCKTCWSQEPYVIFHCVVRWSSLVMYVVLTCALRGPRLLCVVICCAVLVSDRPSFTLSPTGLDRNSSLSQVAGQLTFANELNVLHPFSRPWQPPAFPEMASTSSAGLAWAAGYSQPQRSKQPWHL
jgi:hypothetical protein